MPKQSYYEGWGYSDTIKLLLKGSEANRNSLFKELKEQFPKEDIEKSGSQIIEAFVYERQIPTIKKMARIFSMKVMYMGGGKTDDIEIAKIILQQLGGQGRLVVMTGAYNFVALRNGVSFKIKNRSVNYVEIKLNGKDLYDVKFGRIAVGKLKVKSEHNDVYFDELIPLFEKETGMYLRLFKKGGFVSTQNRDMVLGQLKSIHHHEEELRNALKTSGEIEAWVLAKVQRATTDLSDVTHYVDARKEFAKGGLVRNREYYHILSAPNNKFQLAYLGFGNLAKNITENSIVQRYTPLFNSKMEAEKYFANIYGKLKDKDKKNATLIDSTVTPSTIVFANRGEIFNSFDPKVQEWNNLISEFLKSQKLAKGGAIESFIYEDVEYPDSKSEIDEDEIDEFIEDWNERMETNYSSWEDFNKGEKYYKLSPMTEYAKGGMVDLFEDYEKIPPKVQSILDKYAESFEDGSYEGLTKAHKELDKIGYTFEFYLDGQAYGLRPSNVPLNKLKGYEEFAKGGVVENEISKMAFDDIIFLITNALKEKTFNFKNNTYYFTINSPSGSSIYWREYDGSNWSISFDNKYREFVFIDYLNERYKTANIKDVLSFIKQNSVVSPKNYITGLRSIDIRNALAIVYENQRRTWDKRLDKYAKGGMTDDEALHTLLFEDGGMPTSMPIPQGLSVADANPYIATAKAVQGIAPQSVSALDQRLARKLNPDPNRPVFFAKGGKTSC